MSRKLKKIGILGGTFDPCHKGHLKISKEAKKKIKLSKEIWAGTKKNPFKRKGNSRLEERLENSRKFTKKYKFIQVSYYEKIIKSNKTINLIKYLNKKYKNSKLYLIMGADNLINFHKWNKWINITSRCDIIVFDRYPYNSKALKSLAFKQIDRQKLKFINFKKVNISSSQLRKI